MTLSNNGNTFTGGHDRHGRELAVSTGALANSSPRGQARFRRPERQHRGQDLTGASGARSGPTSPSPGAAGSRNGAVNQTVDGTYAGSFTEGGSRPIPL
ncbi:MAG: hypothetical protein U1F87_09445 [Kiritimatiellia bacterium]